MMRDGGDVAATVAIDCCRRFILIGEIFGERENRERELSYHWSVGNIYFFLFVQNEIYSNVLFYGCS